MYSRSWILNHTKILIEELKLPDSLFLQGDVRSSVLKMPKTNKTHGLPNIYNVWGGGGGGGR